MAVEECWGGWERTMERRRGGQYCIPTLNSMLFRLERAELTAHGWLYKSTSHETPSAPLLGWSFKPTLMHFFFPFLEWCDTFSLSSGARFILLARVEWIYLTRVWFLVHWHCFGQTCWEVQELAVQERRSCGVDFTDVQPITKINIQQSLWHKHLCVIVTEK